MRQIFLTFLALAGWIVVETRSQAEPQSKDLNALIQTIREVGPEGKGNRAASQAWTELASRGKAEQLPELLASLDGASPLAANWLRSAADTIAERQLQQTGTLPVAALEKFLLDEKHDPRVRRMAYEWIARADAAAPDRLIPQMLNDSSLEMRRDAVARLLTAADQAAEKKDDKLAFETYRKGLEAARDLDQVKAAAEALKKLEHPVNLAEHFGFLLDWKLVGPFDNVKGKGFDVAYPPEAKIDLAASYPGQVGQVSWLADHTDDEYGAVDLNKALGKHKGAAAYATCEFQSSQARPVELRLGSEAANKIWLNGKLLCANEVYHANGTMDQYVGRGELKPGKNVILVKVCQNEQTEDWAQDWKFNLRVCDASGKAVLATDRPALRAAEGATAATGSTAPSGTKE